SRIEDENTGEVRIPEFHAEIPPERLTQARATAEALGEKVYAQFPWVPGARPMASAHDELLLNRTWPPTLSVTRIDGIPALSSAGNVLRPRTSVKLSMRIPPTVEPSRALATLKQVLERDPPYGARVTFEGEKASTGWDAPPLAPWLERAVA